MMKKDLVTITILSTIFVRGDMYKEGEEVEVNQREAKENLAYLESFRNSRMNAKY